MTFRDFFDLVCVINLPQRTDRKRQIVGELNRVGLWLAPGHIEVFPAIRPTEAAGFPTIGYRGCFLSHLEVLKKAHREKARNLLIIEDDLTISDRFKTDEESLINQLDDQNWGMCYFGHGLDDPPRDEPTILRPYYEQVLLGHFYAIHHTMFEPLIEFKEAMLTRPPGHPDGGPQSHDGALWTFRQKHPEFRTLVTSPNLGWQRASMSDNTPKWFDRVMFLNQAAGVARRAKVWLRGH